MEAFQEEPGTKCLGGTVVEKSDAFESCGFSLIWILDIIIACLLLITTFPLWVVVGILIKLTSPGPIFFIQERLGKDKAPFKLIKFRTMVVGAETGPMWAKKDDHRVTPLGRFLRKSRLDELPQLINILKGDMSFVGPRPVTSHSANLLKAADSAYDKRFLVKPGLTGWSQLYVCHGDTLGEQLQKLPFDLQHLKGMSLVEYFKIFLLTGIAVFKGKGI